MIKNINIGDKVKERTAWQSYRNELVGTVTKIERVVDDNPGTDPKDISGVRFVSVESAPANSWRHFVTVTWDNPDDIPSAFHGYQYETGESTAGEWIPASQ